MSKNAIFIIPGLIVGWLLGLLIGEVFIKPMFEPKIAEARRLIESIEIPSFDDYIYTPTTEPTDTPTIAETPTVAPMET